MTVTPPCLLAPRIVCAIEATEAPFTGGVEVDINGKHGHSPPHVQFTYQVSACLAPLTRSGRTRRVRPLLLTPGRLGAAPFNGSHDEGVGRTAAQP